MGCTASTSSHVSAADLAKFSKKVHILHHTEGSRLGVRVWVSEKVSYQAKKAVAAV